MTKTDYDLFVIGGGVNGCGIARDASGRGIKVGLAEMNDFASATSSASTKLFHGGLRYLEYFEFRLVRESLAEREILLQMMPHISWPMRFVLPLHPEMRFESSTPASRLLTFFMPWLKGRRPAWMIRFGLFLYDHIGGRKILPGTSSVDLTKGAEGAALKDDFRRAYEYSDCWVDDARLVALNALDARVRGADIMKNIRVTHAENQGDHWIISLDQGGKKKTITARAIVNAAGPWVEDILKTKIGKNSREGVRLVRGSHIVVKQKFNHGKCYFFQGTDGRITFAIPYEDDFTLIGTTDQEHDVPDNPPVCTPEEQQYLIDFVNAYFETPISDADVVWTYSGVRPLYDDGAKDASAATRDYVLSLDTQGAPLMSVFGGKITSFRELAEDALEQLSKLVPMGGHWTHHSHLPGGDFDVAEVDALRSQLQNDYAYLDGSVTDRLFRTYGRKAWDVLGQAATKEDLGVEYAPGFTQAEIDYLVDHEMATSVEDVLWRRTKMGLRVDQKTTNKIKKYLANRA